MIDLDKKEKEVLSGLKDFQLATVERIYELFTSGQSRVLVADEVGLGKTLIAKGVIAKIALYHKNELNDDLFKVVYICSNQSIATQNLSKLKLYENVTIDGLTDARLSMQHLKIYENESNIKIKENYIQLIPLTPSTSFSMTGGGGSVNERALMFALLKRYPKINIYYNQLEVMMIDEATISWGNWAKKTYERRVDECDLKSGNYIADILFKIDKYFIDNPVLLENIIEDFIKIKESGNVRIKNMYKSIFSLRKMFAEISIELMDPDLVIMDEFQRFPELIKNDNYSETALLANKFFNAKKRDNEKIKILLLSATPYKLYSTLEEIYENNQDEHFKEFLQVMEFIFENNIDKIDQFKNIWTDYSMTLNEISNENFSIVLSKKNNAEQRLFEGICRTERLLVKGAEDMISFDNKTANLDVTEDDILSYIEVNQMLGELNEKIYIPIEYIKSAPYIMSFMNQYNFSKRIFKYLVDKPDKMNIINKSNLWIRKEEISSYKKLSIANARMSKLIEVSLPKQSERLLWIPPSKPYYELGGPFKGQERFSKTLVFSSWTMVPRVISTIVSYEAERRTVGKIIKNNEEIPEKNRYYFSEKRYPEARLRFTISGDNYNAMSLFALMYPSETLADLVDIVDVLNRKLKKKELEKEIEFKIVGLLNQIEYVDNGSNRVDMSWYYLAPILFDKLLGNNKGETFIDGSVLNIFESDKEDKYDNSAMSKHIEKLKAYNDFEGTLILGKKPDDLVDVLVKMTMGSPGICYLRRIGITKTSPSYAFLFSKSIIDKFNHEEATAIILLEYKEKIPYWKKALQYCVDGNLQAMIDEYTHMLIEANGLSKAAIDYKNKELTRIIVDTLKTHTASYNVDTFNSFKKRVNDKNRNIKARKDRNIKMRTNYAVGFINPDSSEKIAHRKSSIRMAFNSPFRPFVLASTSIGQEGLDFHYYCRRIMHWNLPSNPVDIEQREGRINRFKGLAIRQSIANMYGDIVFKDDIWNDMFTAAKDNEVKESTSELVPFWCLPNNEYAKIERIVPMYPMSKDVAKYHRLMKILSVYRLSLGQMRQEELVEYIIKNDLDEDNIKNLFMNLSPYYRNLE